ncbi:glycosyltransferase [Psychrobacter immobilis]|uniref:glycosyltransferase n=1 Tax=Psychrobacter immobilis TaxID=498 RepID=UPI00191A6714|nr:glycosyltransferase [Psychrobacter immobilis]
MLEIMQHCFGKDNSGGPVKAFHRLIKYSSLKFSVIRQLDGAGGLDIQLIKEFIKEIKKEKPLLIHIRGLGNEGFHAALAAKIAGVPKILVSIHGTHRDLVNDLHPIKRWIMVNILEMITLNIATDIVTVCEYANKRKFLSPYKNKLRNPIPNGVPIPKLLNKNEITELRKQLGIDNTEIVGICVSRITLEKGYLVLAEALKKIDREDNKFTLLIVGDGDEDNSIKVSYSKLKYIKVRFIGYVESVNDYLSISNFFIFPTFHENLSNALIEAMSYQLPIIATSVGGNTEVVEKGGGVLTRANDVDSLASSIKEFVNDPDFISEIGIKARNNIIDNYSVAKMVKSWERLYINIIEEINE